MIGIRRALALLILSFFVIQFAMTAWLGPDELLPVNLGLALCYGLAFFGLAAEWFWARWFAMGVGNFGSLMLLVLFKIGPEPIFVFFGVTHLLVVLCLTGEGMAAKYEYSEKTSERWNFQEDSMALMRRAVKSAGSTLPLLILYALAPRGEWLQLGLLAVGVVGFVGLVRGKTWGPLMLGATGVVCLLDGLGVFGPPTIGYLILGPETLPALYGKVGVFAGATMLVMVPFIAPMIRYLRAPQLPART
ncbi:hypothetical protein ENSA5_20310 [Enhygromyxa salina]|uniref:Uncharacterized protein n=1 Tax=Enhygromyxa salina TaxID=215803 RepID=A0A2S9YCL3_9BACT|nr:hypothetical protein [Enhygromyxa salina]PRQ02854.1 hypothetical protein ENSA5_20310 [Enhygromyxa salina]